MGFKTTVFLVFVCTTFSQYQIHFDIIQNYCLTALNMDLYRSEHTSGSASECVLLTQCSMYIGRKAATTQGDGKC